MGLGGPGRLAFNIHPFCCTLLDPVPVLPLFFCFKEKRELENKDLHKSRLLLLPGQDEPNVPVQVVAAQGIVDRNYIIIRKVIPLMSQINDYTFFSWT